MDSTKHQISAPLVCKLIRKTKPSSADKTTEIVRSQAHLGMSSVTVLMPKSSKVITPATPEPVPKPTEQSNQDTAPSHNPEDITTARLEFLTGLNFTLPNLHIKPNTSVTQTPNRRVRRILKHDVNVVNWLAGIDKANGKLFEAVNIEELKARADKLGLDWRYEKIGEDDKKTQALRIGARNGEHIHLELKHIRSAFSRNVISNPNRFTSAVSYFRFLTNLFGLNQVEYFKLGRLDLNVDVEEDFEKVWRMLRVKFKQIGNQFTSKSGNVTGLRFGKGNFVICVYNKTAQMLKKGVDLKKAVTRIEIRLQGNAIPFEYIYELPKLIKPTRFGGELPQLFSSVYIQPFTLADKNIITHDGKKEKLIELRTRIDEKGLDTTIKKLNKNGNFIRDHKGLIVFQDYPHDLNTILLSNLHRFFGKRMLVL